jgi:hypothetical protein
VPLAPRVPSRPASPEFEKCTTVKVIKGTMYEILRPRWGHLGPTTTNGLLAGSPYTGGVDPCPLNQVEFSPSFIANQYKFPCLNSVRPFVFVYRWCSIGQSQPSGQSSSSSLEKYDPACPKTGQRPPENALNGIERLVI